MATEFRSSTNLLFCLEFVEIASLAKTQRGVARSTSENAQEKTSVDRLAEFESPLYHFVDHRNDPAKGGRLI